VKPNHRSEKIKVFRDNVNALISSPGNPRAIEEASSTQNMRTTMTMKGFLMFDKKLTLVASDFSFAFCNSSCQYYQTLISKCEGPDSIEGTRQMRRDMEREKEM